MTEHYDALETRAPEARTTAQFDALRRLLHSARGTAPAIAARVVEDQIAGLTDREALARLPVLRKSNLGALQREHPPLGGFCTRPAGQIAQLFQSPGPIYEPGIDAPDWWRLARALHAAGMRPGDRVINCFAYHLTPAGHMLENAARALGCSVIPGGIGNTEAQAIAAADLGATGYVGTPDFLKTLLDKADALERPIGIKRAIVSGGPLFPAMRAGYAERGISCLQCYATADVGLIAYESMDGDGVPLPGMAVDEGAIVEIVRPGTGDPVPDGEVGEVVVTPLNPDYPLLRLATGDLSAITEGPSPCGRTAPRIKGWMGRADQTTKVKGMFVRPEQIAVVVGRHPEIGRARLTVSREGDADAMVLAVECSERSEGLAPAIEASLRDLVKLRGTVELVDLESLPNDGKVIDDTRDFSGG
ncbi:MAG: AMP-binding protein [Pseudomonadota bacterium]